MLATISRLPAIPAAAIQRAAALLPTRRNGPLISPTMQTWALLEANRQREAEREREDSREGRLAELRRLEEVGKNHLCRLEGYGGRY